MKHIIFILFLISLGQYGLSQGQDHKVKIGVAGMTHGHVHWILRQMNTEHYTVTGIAESNTALAERLFKQYNIPDSLLFSSLEEMVDRTHPDGVVAFNSIYEHLETVEVCAPRHIHVMVEKPLAVNNGHARKMADLARENNIMLLTNYETTWYATTRKILYDVPAGQTIGEIRKIEVRDGHMGPKEIGVNEEFFDWLTDPMMNGGGALIDFGCYGANLITGLMKNNRPVTVTAFTQQIKPDIYPDVEDEATILLTYSRTQGIIQASWNWPFNRKDMDIYGTGGAIFQLNGNEMQIRKNGNIEDILLPPLKFPRNDPFAFFSAAIKGELVVDALDLSSLENNLIVVEILDASRRSAQQGETIYLK